MPPAPGCPGTGTPSSEVTGSICLVPSTPFSQAPWYTLPVHLCRFRVRSVLPELFPGTPSPPAQSNKHERHTVFVTSGRPRNIDLVPIDYGFRPRLRGRLTLRGLALRRNPWTFGESVSHTLYRYSRQHSRFPALHPTSRSGFTAQGTLRYHAHPEGCASSASARGLSPVTSSPQDSLTRPVSCYAFFK